VVYFVRGSGESANKRSSKIPIVSIQTLRGQPKGREFIGRGVDLRRVNRNSGEGDWSNKS